MGWRGLRDFRLRKDRLVALLTIGRGNPYKQIEIKTYPGTPIVHKVKFYYRKEFFGYFLMQIQYLNYKVFPFTKCE